MADLIQIEVKGQESITKKIGLLSTKLNPRDLLDESAAVLLNHIRTRFIQQIDSSGQAWIPSKASTLRASGRGGGTLFDTGRLFHSLQAFTRGEFSRAIGSDVPYGKFHNYGTVRLPRREFLAFGQQDVKVVQDILIRRITEAING